MSEKQVFEINGIKMEVDTRYAKRVDTFRIGTKVKIYLKDSYGTGKVVPGVVIGFEPFETLPTITVCYLDISYSGAELKFAHINSSSNDKYEIVASIDDDLPIQKDDVLSKMDKEIESKRNEIEDIEAKRRYFLEHFNQYFEPEVTA